MSTRPRVAYDGIGVSNDVETGCQLNVERHRGTEANDRNGHASSVPAGRDSEATAGIELGEVRLNGARGKVNGVTAPAQSSAAGLNLVAVVVDRLGRLERDLGRLEAQIDAQHETIRRLEAERAAGRVRVAELESHLYGGIGTLASLVTKHIAIVVVLMSILATLLAATLAWFDITLGLTDPFVIGAFIIGVVCGAIAMATHLLR